ncbi:MAG: nicotinate (nicotinamide) nucleotide adenylyltransferase [Clostridia bacterium]|nr:nicotinate (nicotinamide) nucleotide adenylyltransferase [Clostridia bacterium]
MENRRKIKTALFGGTFAPPHLGHVHAVETILRHAGPDEILIMPTAVPPHKVKAKGDTPELRLEMCRAAFGTLDRVTVSDYEIRKGGVSYTVQTLEHFAENEPEREIHLVCGTDMFLTLDKWFRAADIFRLAKIICIPRDRTDLGVLTEKQAEYAETYRAETQILEVEPIDMSSTEIRRRIESGEDLDAFLPSAVTEIIKRENLYDAENT